jgi:serine/threonine protein kinase
MAGAAGQVLGDRYRLVQQIATGSMGEVWRGYDEVREREVAAKEVRPGHLIRSLPVSLPDELAAPIMHEAAALARLDHRGIAATYDAVRCDGTPWIVMEFIPGPCLAQVIAAQGPLGWQRAAALGADLAQALGYAHGAGVIHARLNPSNVLLAAGRTVITDFALTDFILYHLFGDLDHVIDSRIDTRVVEACRYLAPEQVQGDPVRAPADLWALGATLYTAVEGCPPFPDRYIHQILNGICFRPIPAPRHAGPMASILSSLITRDPGQRPNASAAAELLHAVAANETGSALRRPGTVDFWASCLLRGDVRAFSCRAHSGLHAELMDGALSSASLGPAGSCAGSQTHRDRRFFRAFPGRAVDRPNQPWPTLCGRYSNAGSMDAI